MLPPRALSFPSQSHDDPLTVELLDLCARRGLLTGSPLQIGVTPDARTAPILLLIEASSLAHIAAWLDRLHAHHASAGLLLDDPDLLAPLDLLAMPGLGLWPIFTGGIDPPLIMKSPAEISETIRHLPQRPRLIMPRPGPLGLATDAMLLGELYAHGISHVIVPELQLTGTSHPHIAVTRHRRVDPQRDTAAQLLSWIQGDRLEQARSGARSLSRAVRERAHALRQHFTP